MSEKAYVDVKHETSEPARLDPTLEQVRQALLGLKFGHVSIVVQDGVVVQLERVERKRFRRGERP